MHLTCSHIGNELLSKLSHTELLYEMWTAMQMKISEVGGADIWEQMTHSSEEQELREAGLTQDIALKLGKSSYSSLADSERREYELFFRGGCCMHKDLNAVKGGDKAMGEIWHTLGIPGPILLANKDNTAVLEDPSLGGTDALTRAMEVSGRGGVKVTTLAGMVFNNKDKKKGQQDTYRWYFFNVLGYSVKFPDTSNTRYGSHCDAAAELLRHLPIYIRFLEFVRDRKEKQVFTNVEQNIWRGLHCSATLTELAVLASYGQTISIPYMAFVRGLTSESAGSLEMGPTHMFLLQHIKTLLRNPGLLDSMGSTPEQSTLYNQQWDSNEVFFTVKALIPSLSHFRAVLLAFLQGSLETWERFSADYQSGGVIALATPEERALAYMPVTNDRNEGALGSMRQDARHRPNHSSLSFNSAAALKHNNTSAFIESSLTTKEDIHYLRRVARELDSSGLETMQVRAQATYDEDIVCEKRQKAEGKVAKNRLLQDSIDYITLTDDIAILSKESKAILELRLKKYRQFIHGQFKVPKLSFVIPVQSKITRQADRISEILRCHDKYTTTLSLQTSSTMSMPSKSPKVDHDGLESDHDMDSI